MSSNEPGDAVRVVNAVLTSLDALKRRPNVLVLCTSNMQSAIDPAFRDRVDLQIFLGPPSLRARYYILRSCLEELSLKGLISPPCALAELSEQQLEAAAAGAVTGSVSVSAQGQGLSSSGGQKRNQLEQWAHDSNSSSSSSSRMQEHEEGGERSDTSMQVDTDSSPSSSPSSDRHLAQRAVAATLEEKLLRIAQQCSGFSGRSLRKLPLKAHAMYLQRKKVSLEQYLDAIATTIHQQK